MDSLTSELDEPATYWRAVVESAGLGVWDYNLVTGEKRYSTRWREIRHLSASDPLPETDEDWFAMVHPDDVEVARRYTELINGGFADEVAYEYRQRSKTGHWVWIICRGRSLSHDENGRATRFVGVDTDISKIKNAEEERAIHAKQLEIAVAMAGVGIWKFDSQAGEVTWDSRLRNIYGIPDDGKPLPPGVWESAVHPDDRDRVFTATRESIAAKKDYTLNYRIIRTDGEPRHIRSRASFASGALQGSIMLGVDWDVTDDLMQAFNLERMNRLADERLAELHRVQKDLERLARHDPLTGLPNRRSLQEYLQRFEATESRVSSVSFIMMDIDQFKEVNDRYGHAFGDRLLQAVAGALDAELSSSGLLARTGGDEFLAILENPSTDEIPMKLAKAAIARAREVSRAIGHEVTLSIGINTGCPRSTKGDELFMRADRAMYRAKDMGGARAVLA